MVKHRRRKQFDTSNLRDLVTRIEANRISNMGDLSSQIHTSDLANFAQELSHLFVDEKMSNIQGVDLFENGTFRTVAAYGDHVYGVRISPLKMTPTNNRQN